MVRTLDSVNLSATDYQLISNVEDGKWHNIVVPQESGTPAWGFTVGLYHNFQHPEIVMFGAPQEHLPRLLNNMGRKVMERTKFEVGKRYPGIIVNYDCVFQTVDQRWLVPFLGYAVWFYEHEDFPVLQCFWPDKGHHFPWEREFNKAALYSQPLLYVSDPTAARAAGLLKTLS